MSEIVFAFDRDWTVDVNPHPKHKAVPLEWVRHLAHETDHPVYAIGNQDLVEEAEIPGVAEIVDRHPDDNHEWLGDLRESGRWERFPTRRERLGLVADLHPAADARVVVDDIDLSDVAGWDHYHAWDFVPAVERGDIDPDLPWAREPVTDGGLSFPHGIEPATASEMQSFLDMYGQGAGYDLSYSEDGDRRTVRVYGCTPQKRSFDRPAAAQSLKCYPVDTGTQAFTVRVDDIVDLDPVDLPSDPFREVAEMPLEEAIGLGRLAEIEPGAVPLPALIGLLEQDEDGDQDDDVRRVGLQALHTVASARPSDSTAAVPTLHEILQEEDPSRAMILATLGTLRHVANHDTEAVAPLADDLIPFLDCDFTGPPRDVASIVADIVDVYPADVRPAVPELGALLEERRQGQRFAAYAFSTLSRDDPMVVEGVAETLGEIFVDDSLPDGLRLNAGAAFGRYVGQTEGVDVGFLDDLVVDDEAAFVADLVQVLESENDKLRNNAIGVVGDLAQRHTDLVEPHVDSLLPLLQAEDRFTRINASAAFSRVAEDAPDAVRDRTDDIVDLLDDEESLVRTNACWALGYLEAEQALEHLEQVAHEDQNEDVRNRAAWAHAKIVRHAAERAEGP